MTTTAIPRSIRQVIEAPAHRHGSGLVTRDASAEVLGADMSPYIMASLYDMTGPTFPPHPHAGFAVATYMLPESPVGFINQDSIGHFNRIPPGALHITVAGSGLLHEEQPELSGKVARGFQIWIDLPNALREKVPQALHLATADVPVFKAPGVQVRVVLGESQGLYSPMELPIEVRLIDVTMQPGAAFTQNLVHGENAFVVMLQGQVQANGALARSGELVRTAADGELLKFVAGAQGARFTLFAGLPLRQPRVQRGPFVASDVEQLERYMQRFEAGQFGSLVPFAKQRRAT